MILDLWWWKSLQMHMNFHGAFCISKISHFTNTLFCLRTYTVEGSRVRKLSVYILRFDVITIQRLYTLFAPVSVYFVNLLAAVECTGWAKKVSPNDVYNLERSSTITLCTLLQVMTPTVIACSHRRHRQNKRVLSCPCRQCEQPIRKLSQNRNTVTIKMHTNNRNNGDNNMQVHL